MTWIIDFFQHITIDHLLLIIGQRLLSCGLIYLIFLAIRWLIRLIFKQLMQRTALFTVQDIARQKTLFKLGLSLSDYALFFLTLYAMLAVIGVPVSSLLAGAGIAGLAIGLGAQGFLTDLINGAFILIERQFDVGDTVTIQGITGKVSNLGIRTTQLKSSDGIVHFIPNRNITYVSNQSRNNRRVQIDLPLPFDTDFSKVTELLTAACQEQVKHYPQILEGPFVLGARKALDGTSVYRIEFLVANGSQETIYYTFYQLCQATLQNSGLAWPERKIKS